jgi:hypothetical protein
VEVHFVGCIITIFTQG